MVKSYLLVLSAMHCFACEERFINFMAALELHSIEWSFNVATRESTVSTFWAINRRVFSSVYVINFFMEKKKGKDDVPFFYRGRKSAIKSKDFQGENDPDLTTGEQIAELPDNPSKIISEHPIPIHNEWIPKCVEIQSDGKLESGEDACTSRTPTAAHSGKEVPHNQGRRSS